MSKSNISIGLDIGTTKIVAMIGQLNEYNKIKILGVGKSVSLGVHRGVVNNITQTIQSIQQAVEKAEEVSGIKVTEVTVGIAGQHIRSLQHSDYITRPNSEQVISEDDIEKLINQVHKLVMLPGEEIIHVLPQEFKIDGQGEIKEPVGMYGVRLEANFHVVVGQVSSIRNIGRCIKSAALDLEGITLEPLALSEEELDQIIDNYESSDVNISVGFNRRFAPLSKQMKKVLGDVTNPINIVANMNAGFIPKDSWVHDMEVGGGRIIGEACHYIDLCSYLAESKVVSVCMNAMGVNPKENTDNASILLKYENGSNAVINYFSNGSKSYSKERIEVYSQERTLVMDNWRKLRGYGFKNFSNSSSSQDKGHYNQFKQLLEQHKNGGLPIISFDQIINTTKASFAAIKSMKERKWVSII